MFIHTYTGILYVHILNDTHHLKAQTFFMHSCAIQLNTCFWLIISNSSAKYCTFNDLCCYFMMWYMHIRVHMYILHWKVSISTVCGLRSSRVPRFSLWGAQGSTWVEISLTYRSCISTWLFLICTRTKKKHNNICFLILYTYVHIICKWLGTCMFLIN